MPLLRVDTRPCSCGHGARREEVPRARSRTRAHVALCVLAARVGRVSVVSCLTSHLQLLRNPRRPPHPELLLRCWLSQGFQAIHLVGPTSGSHFLRYVGTAWEFLLLCFPRGLVQEGSHDATTGENVGGPPVFTVLRPESTLSAPPEQSESVRYQMINQSTRIKLAWSIELKERACWQAGSSWFNLFCSMMVAKCC